MIKPKILSLISIMVLSISSIPLTTLAQRGAALERGYRTGYSDGYQAGFHDQTGSVTRDHSGKQDYISGDRGYSQSFGTLEEYRDGYQQGYEAGYHAGYDGKSFDSTVPPNLQRRVGGQPQQTIETRTGASSGVRTTVDIPENTVFVLELLTNLSTDATQKGDRFQAKVIEPGEFQGATVDGRVTRVKRAGKLRGTAEMQLSFDQIRLADNRWANIHAQFIELVEKRESNVGKIDEEGGLRGRGSMEDDAVKVGAGAGLGAIIGAIAGGGTGAAVGAVIGGAVGTGGVIATRGKDIRLSKGQYFKIRTTNETRID
jgi:hypothetical protein